MAPRDSIRKDFWQGILKLFILNEMAICPVYGNKIKRKLQEMGYNISPGTLYPTLHALEKAGLCKSKIKIYKGRVRRYYQITDQGRFTLDETRDIVVNVLQSLYIK
jgi:DNA-binding PadR family transcriptional regulator